MSERGISFEESIPRGARSFADPSTHFEIEVSQPGDHDGRYPGEPVTLRCACCGASVELDRDPTTPGVDDLDHRSDCPQRFVRSEWFREQVLGGPDRD